VAPLGESRRPGPGLENGRSSAHIQVMAKPRRIRLLEVNLVALKPDRWEWRVCEGETPIVIGFENSRETAQIEGDNALFKLLSEGMPPKRP